ncbi:hypothetical protein [Sulfitobacter sp. PM12]|uniref:hypothetical protein n=1 Tax=Sulfitobacter sp. PM12 TaxID=3138497 RepID=UPI00388DE9D9
MEDDFDTFMSALKAEEDQVRQELSADRMGFFPVYAMREYDFFFNRFKERTDGDSSEELDEMYYLLRLGLPRGLALALSLRDKYDVPTIMPVHKESLAAKARETIVRLGIIEHGRRLAVASKTGELQLRRTSQRSYEFTIPSTWIDYDLYEEAVERHFAEQGRKKYFEEYNRSKATQGLEKELHQLAHANVFVFMDYFIGYNAHPTLDDHFFGLAYFFVSLSPGFDSFKFNLKFGGVSYIKYMLAVVYLYSLALKHEWFCRALLRKHPDIDPRNILTISSEKEGFIANFAEALNMYGPSFDGFTFTTSAELEVIYKVLSARRDNIDVLRPNGAPIPMLLEFSDTSVFRCLAGAQENPIQVLLNGLRHHFPDDYNSNQQTREASLQRAIERILRGGFDGLVFKRNVILKDQGRDLTDIDLVVVEERSNTVLLFQIKAQDSYGSELNARLNRSKRFADGSRRWVDVTKDWLSRTANHDLRSRFGMSRSPQALNVRLIVLSRFFAHFGFEEETPEDVTYCTWSQFFNAVTKAEARHGQLRTLGALFSLIVRDEIRRNVDRTIWPERNLILEKVEFATVNE